MKGKFINMGFPEDALQYLNENKVSILKEAINIETINKLLMFDAKKIEHSTVWLPHICKS